MLKAALKIYFYMLGADRCFLHFLHRRVAKWVGRVQAVKVLKVALKIYFFVIGAERYQSNPVVPSLPASQQKEYTGAARGSGGIDQGCQNSCGASP